eukprot:GHVR01019137.1.p1 GENE.GHVR01019137.1~~GHVR01019137.1.p1  ORF type:complete len:114 (+),score=31.03 GHVR01019137.1:147-488(+)
MCLRCMLVCVSWSINESGVCVCVCVCVCVYMIVCVGLFELAHLLSCVCKCTYTRFVVRRPSVPSPGAPSLCAVSRCAVSPSIHLSVSSVSPHFANEVAKCKIFLFLIKYDFNI